MYLIVCIDKESKAYLGELMVNNMPIIFDDRLQAVECASALNDGAINAHRFYHEWVVRTIHGDKLQDA